MNNDLLAYLEEKYKTERPDLFDVGVSKSTATTPAVTPPPPPPDFKGLTMADLPVNQEEVIPTDFQPGQFGPTPVETPKPPQMPAAAPLPPTPAKPPAAPPIAPPAPSAAPSPAVPAPVETGNAFHKPVEIDPLAGFSAADRAKVVEDNRPGAREIIGESLAGLGDAISRSFGKSGTSGNHLKGAMAAVDANRAEAVNEFDKNRATAQQNYEMARQVVANNRADASAEDMRNPNSAISKAQQNLLDKLEPGKDHSKISALQAEVLVKPMLERYKIDETAQARKDAAADRLALAEASRDQRVSKQNEDRIQNIRKEITGSKAYQNWLEIKNANDNLQNAAANPGAKRSLGAVYSWVKALDPGSVVREGEIKLAGEARSVGQKLEGYFRRMATGEVLLPEEVKELAAWAKDKTDIARQTAVASNQPAVEQAKRNNFDMAEINKDLFGEMKAAPPPLGPNEVMRKTADGRLIVYDATTKKPLREVTQ